MLGLEAPVEKKAKGEETEDGDGGDEDEKNRGGERKRFRKNKQDLKLQRSQLWLLWV